MNRYPPKWVNYKIEADNRGIDLGNQTVSDWVFYFPDFIVTRLYKILS